MSQPTGGSPGPTGSGQLEPAERDELERLRREVETLRRSRARTRSFSWRSVAAAIIITVGCVLAPLSLVTAWVHNQVANTDRFVATMSPLIEEPTVQAAVTDRVTDAIFRYVKPEQLATEAVDAVATRGDLPPAVSDRLRGLTAPLTSAVRGFVHDQIADLVASERGRQVWNRAIRAGHHQVDAVLSGRASAVTISGDQVRLDLAPFIDAAKRQLSDAGFTAVERLPEVHPTIAVGNAQTLIQAQTAYQVLDKLATWLPWVMLVLLGIGVYVARNHRRALVGTGVGIAIGMVVVAVGLFVARTVLVNSVPDRSAAPVSAAFDVVVRFLRDGLRTAFVVALLVALAAFLVGPSTTATQIRRWLSRFVAWLRRGGAKAGLRTGKVGGWVHAHRRLLQAAVVVLAVLVFILLSPPSGVAAIVIALALVLCLGVIQFLDQPPADPSPEDQQDAATAG